MTGRLGRLSAEGAVVVSHAPERAHWLARIARATASLTLPVFLSVLTLMVAWELRATPLTSLDGVFAPSDAPELRPSAWLGVGHAIVPVLFLLSNLVNRRYGEDYAIAFVLASWAFAALTTLAIIYRIDPSLAAPPVVPTLRVAASFFGAMVIAQLLGVFVFDRTRGVDWWKAPLYSALTSAFVATFLFYPFAFAGDEWTWLNHMSIDAGVKAAMSFALLLPYLALRSIVRPLGGFGGF